MKIAKGTWILLALVWVGLYWPLLADGVPAFRDAFHFYYPLEHWLDGQARAGNLFPLFNPFDGTGTNLLGETSTGLCYPGRCLWWLPGLSVAQRFGCVLLAHTAVAGIGAAYAARRMQLAAAPQLLAATAYSLAGPVFFQHVNPIYLISAAWLPWAIGESWVLARSGDACEQVGDQPGALKSPDQNVRWWVWVSACSMMMLGGDPQATLHCGLVMVIALLCHAWRAHSLVRLLSAGLRLLLAVIGVTGLTAAQSLPTWHWYRTVQQDHAIGPNAQSDRVPELLRDLQPLEYDVARGSSYAYSVAPWHLVSMLWSNSQGHFMAEHTRYLAASPAEPRMWTASLSIGLMTLLLALSCLASRTARRDTSFLWLIALLAGTAMLGNYAPVWILRNGLRWLAIDSSWLPSDEVGGTMWWLNQCVPGYSAFRYPAKWSPIFAVALVLCGAYAHHHHNLVMKSFARALVVTSWLTWSLCLLIAMMLLIPALRSALTSWIDRAPPDAWLGAIDASAAQAMLGFSLILSGLVLLAALWMYRSWSTQWQAYGLVWLVLIEMSCAARPWLASVPASDVTFTLPAEPSASSITDATPVTRIWAGVGRADIARDFGDVADMRDKLRYQQTFGLGKLHLLSAGTGNLSAFMTLTPRSLAHVRHHLAQRDRLVSHDPQLDEALAWLGVQWRLVRSDGVHWQPIANAAPLLEMVADDASKNTLHVKYCSGSRMRIDVASASGARVLVRLFQDGGWRATLRDARASWKPCSLA